MDPSSIEKIVEIDSHIGCAMSGLTADARTMIERARVEAQVGQTSELRSNTLLWACVAVPMLCDHLAFACCPFMTILPLHANLDPV